MEDSWEIERLNWDRWKLQAMQDAIDIKNGKVPNPYHWPVELLTMDQIIEKYGYTLTDEQVQMLKDGKE